MWTPLPDRASVPIARDTEQRDSPAARLHGDHYLRDWTRCFERPGTFPGDAPTVGPLWPRGADGGGGARSHRPRRVARLREYAQPRYVVERGGTRAAAGADQSVARAGARDRTARSA